MDRSTPLVALALLAIAHVAPAAAQTTTTTSSTTTTTLAAPCTPDATTLPGLTCSLEEYLAAVRAARDAGAFGRLGAGMVRRLEKGVTNLERAARECADADRKAAGKQVDRAARYVAKTRATIRSRNGRRIIPPAVAGPLASQGGTLAADLRRLRKSISCS